MFANINVVFSISRKAYNSCCTAFNFQSVPKLRKRRNLIRNNKKNLETQKKNYILYEMLKNKFYGAKILHFTFIYF